MALIERRHGTRADRGVIHHWLAESCLQTGRRKEALRHLATAARRRQAGAVARDLGGIARSVFVATCSGARRAPAIPDLAVGRSSHDLVGRARRRSADDPPTTPP